MGYCDNNSKYSGVAELPTPIFGNNYRGHYFVPRFWEQLPRKSIEERQYSNKGQVEDQIMEAEEVVPTQVGTSQKDRKVWKMMKMTMTL